MSSELRMEIHSIRRVNDKNIIQPIEYIVIRNEVEILRTFSLLVAMQAFLNRIEGE